MKNLGLAIIALGIGFAGEQAHADAAFGGFLGYSRGTLARGESETMTGFSAQGHVGYEHAPYNVHGFFQTTDVSYSHNGESHQGVYSLYGIGARYSVFPGPSSKISFVAQYPVAATLVTLAESEGTVNDTKYLYSSLVTLSGANAYQVMMGYEYLRQGRGSLKKDENLYLGLYLGYLKQQFTQQVTRIRTNNSVLAPISPGKESVFYAYTLITLYFSLNYDM